MAREAEQPVAGLLQAVGDVTMTQPPLGDELATPILDILGRLGVDHVSIVGGDLLVQALGGVRQQVPVLADRPAEQRG